MKIKKIITSLVSVGLLMTVVSCGGGSNDNTSEDVSASTTITSPYSVKVNPIGSTSINVSRTVTLRANVTGTTEKDVTWSSGDEAIAIVNNKGIVTGVAPGRVTITATLNIDPNAKGSIEIEVTAAEAPTSITIGGYDSNVGWVGESAQLFANITPVTAGVGVDWSVDNTDVAEIDNQGLLTFKAKGNVVVTCTSKIDSNIKDSKALEVKKGIFDTSRSSSLWRFEHQGDDNGYIDLDDSEDNLSASHNFAWFNEQPSTKFYAEAKFKIKRLTSNSWDWMGLGLGSGTTDTDSRFFMYSPHNPGMTANNFNKFIVMNGTCEFDGITTRSQRWGEMGVNSITLDDTVKVGILRNGSDFYYLLNDKVAYFDNTDKFCNGEGVNFGTVPYIVAFDIPVTVKEYSYTSDSNEIDAILNTKEYKKSFYAAYSNVTYEDDSNFSLDVVTTLCKDHKLAALGDKTKLVKDFDIEFDVKNIGYNSEKSCFRGLILAMSRYESSDTIEFVGFGRSPMQEDDGSGNVPSIVRFGKWNYTNSMEVETAVSEYYESKTNIFPNLADTYHVKVTRRIDNEAERAYFHIFVDGVEITDYTVTNKSAKTNVYSTYLGAYLLWIGGEYAKSDISNFKIRSNVQ